MYLFIVQYTENERNTFTVLRLLDDTQWTQFLHAKLPEHMCGYLVKEAFDTREIPFLQRQKYWRSVRDDELMRKEPGESQFLGLLQERALDFDEERLKTLSRSGKKGFAMVDATKPGAPAAPPAGATAPPPAGTAPAGAAPATPAAEKKPRVRFTVDPSKKINLKVTENPRRKGTNTYEIFKKYQNGMTVEEAIKAGVRMVDVKADIERGHIELV